MKKIGLFALAASAALIPAAASAQARHGGPNVTVGHHGGGNVTVRHHGGRFRHPGRNFPHRRLHRGFVVNPFWLGPQFHIQNWQMYGFDAPPRDHRWVRYYDDAYLIDGSGRVHDERYGLDWDEYGERWEMDDGIPSYYGRGDYRPDEEDYDWAERHGGGGDAGGWDYGAYGHGGGYGPHPAPIPACPMPQPCGGHGAGYVHGGGYGGGYGAAYGSYGYGVAYPIIVETTVVTGGTSYYEEVIEEEVVEVQQRRRHYRPPPRRSPPRRSPPRRPPPGERG